MKDDGERPEPTADPAKKEKDTDEKSKPSISRELSGHAPNSLALFAALITRKKLKKIIVLTGAGISTAAGIPDFRSPGTGLYDNLQEYDIPAPEAIFEIGFFHRNPKPFFHLAREMFPGKFKPTLTHVFIRLLHEKGMLLRNYTQNIDALERVAEVPADKLIHAHGSFFTSTCTKCKRKADTHEVLDPNSKDKDAVPYCKPCEGQKKHKKTGKYGIMKPDIVFFGEDLPERFYTNLKPDFAECDGLIVMGTSLVVNPFASLINLPKSGIPRLLINLEKVGTKSSRGSKGFDFRPETHDCFHEAPCDNGVEELATILGWKEDLLSLADQIKTSKATSSEADKADVIDKLEATLAKVSLD